MMIAVHLDRARLFRWHLALVEALIAAGHGINVRFRDTSDPLPTSLTAILDFDRVRNRSDATRFSTHIKPAEFARYIVASAEIADVTLDLSSAATIQRLTGRVLRPAYDGSPKDYALFHALLDRRAPHLTLWDSGAREPFAIGWPGLETTSRLANSLDQATSRLVEGIARYIRDLGSIDADAPSATVTNSAKPDRSILNSAGGFLTARAVRKAGRVRDRLAGAGPKWHVAWRAVDMEATVQPGYLNLADFRVLPDDGARFYADPFLFMHDGTCHMFVEELPDATGTGVISHTVLDRDGNFARPTPVLKTNYHLSYPFVFECDGEIWMLPEQSAAGGLDLYRCTKFPDTWVHAARLIDGRIHDATLFEHNGLMWIAAGCEAFQSSTWDGLSLFWATSLLGPWHPHKNNPVTIDARAARPAGPLWRQDENLYRPAQNCSGGYGVALAVKRIKELTRDTFAEESIGALAFPDSQNLLGPHTISRAGGIEVIDLYARPSAVRAAFRGTFATRPV